MVVEKAVKCSSESSSGHQKLHTYYHITINAVNTLLCNHCPKLWF